MRCFLAPSCPRRWRSRSWPSTAAWASGAVYLPGLVDGSAPAALALGVGTLRVADGPGGSTVSGTLRPVLGLGTASVLLAPLDDGGWGLLDPGDASCTALPASTRPGASVRSSSTALRSGPRTAWRVSVRRRCATWPW